MSQDPEVAVLLVSHDGASWLPTVLDGLLAQTAPLGSVVAVDTGSKDDSVSLIRDALDGRVPTLTRTLPGNAGFPDAVADGLSALAENGQEPEWIWILHDDSTPAPDALAALLAATVARPDVDIRSEAARVALPPAAARTGRHHQRHRASRDRPRARRVRPGPARRGP